MNELIGMEFPPVLDNFVCGVLIMNQEYKYIGIIMIMHVEF